MSRLGVFWDPASPDKQNDFRETQMAAQALGIQVRALEVRAPNDLDGAITAVATEPLDALLTLLDGYVAEVVAISTQARLPAMCEARGFTMAGGLMSYGPNPLVWYGRAVDYVDKLLRGAKPTDLPVEQPADIELVVNTKTAQEIGFTIPPSILTQVAEIIQ
jgi:putative tryptophan/tyrosine transport system substrate-binding protein